MPDTSEVGTPDLSRIVNLIMKNPKLIEEISRLAEGSEEEVTAENRPTADTDISYPDAKSEPAPATPASAPISGGARERRAMLISALKPYISSERARAIDSMMSVVEVLDMMKSR